MPADFQAAPGPDFTSQAQTLETPEAQLDPIEDVDAYFNTLPPQADKALLPVVGLGGSAGSVAPLQQFFAAMAPGSGLAFVAVLHLDSEAEPEPQAQLHSVLQACSAMPVVQVLEDTRLEPDHVYVIPPGQHVSLRGGAIELSQPDQPLGRRVAVDLFFRSLAATHRSRAVAIVLSGADSDGAVGIKRVKEAGGVTIVQAPEEAEHQGMPRSAMESGMVDWVLPIAEMPAKLLEFARNERVLSFPQPERVAADLAASSGQAPDQDEAALQEILALLLSRTGHDFSHYKRPTVLRRIGRRLQVHALATFPQYADFLRTHADESWALLQDLLISVTNFFRDKEAFAALEASVGRLFVGKGPRDSVRAWVPGCATGEEAYSLAMLLLEHASTLEAPPAIQIFATDIDEGAARVAREGLYPAAIVADVSPERLERFFVHENGRYRVRKEVRELILFAQHDLLKDSPFSRLDLISCRNLLIYFHAQAQDRVLGLFHFALRPDGLLFLGSSERTDNEAQLFGTLDKKHRLFARLATLRAAAESAVPLPLSLPRMLRAPEAPARASLERSPRAPADAEAARAEDARPAGERRASLGQMHLQLLEEFAPPSILVNAAHEIVHLSASAGKYLQVAPGEISIRLLDMVRPDLRLELRAALLRAAQSGQEAHAASTASQVNGAPQPVSLRVRPMRDEGAGAGASDASAPRFLLVIFEEGEALGSGQVQGSGSAMASDTGGQGALAQQLEAENAQLKAQLQETVEQYEVSVQDLRASNEELLAINRELRSAGEELETGKEEIQAANEELSTLNQELSSKIEEVSRVNADLHNLMASTDIATIFLDRALRIKRYTQRALDLFQLIPTDTGRPLSDLRHTLLGADLSAYATQVLATLAPLEREVAASSGDVFLLRVLPYRAPEDKDEGKAGGVVLTFTDITERKEAEEAQLASEAGFRTISDAAPAMVWVCNTAGEATSFNQRWFEFTGQAEDAALKSGWASAMHPEDARSILPYWERCQATGEVYEGEVRYRRFDGEYRWHHFRALPRRSDAGTIEAWYGVSVDIHGSKADKEALVQSEDGLRLFLSTISDALYRVSPDWSELYSLEGNGFLASPQGTGASWLERYVPQGERTRAQAAIGQAIRAREPLELEHRVLRADGTLGWAFSRAVPRLDESGEVIEWLGAASDITSRKQSEEAMRASQERLRLLSESAQDFALIWTDTRGCVTEWSAGAERVLGFAASEMLGQTLHCIFTPEDVAAGVVEGELRTAEREGRAADERWHLRKDGSRVFLSGAMTRLRGAGGALLGFVKIVRDGSEARRIEDELHESQERLAIALDAAQLGTCDWDYLSGEMQGNARRFKLFGLDPRQGTITEAQFRASMHADDRAATWDAITRGIEERGEYHREFRVVLPGGEVRWITESGRVVERQDGRPRRVAGILWDITERHAAQQVLERSHDEMQRLVRERAGELARVNEALEAEAAERRRANTAREFLLRRLVSTQEEERRRLARELHDQMGQSLTALMMGLKSLPTWPEPEPSAASPSPAEILARLQGITTDLMNEVHHLAWELRPAVLDNLGLRPALEESVRAWSQRSGVRADFLAHSVTVERFPLDIESALYRVRQEALTNVARHSGAQHVSVLLERVAGEVVLIVEDDGRGFDVEARANSGRLGMAGMRERVEMVGGTLNIESGPNSGTTIYVRVPLGPSPSTDAAAE